MQRSLAKDKLSTKIEHDRYILQSVRRAIRLINTFGPTQPEIGLSELSRLTGLNKTTVYRLLLTLEEENYIKQNPNNDKYRLGPVFARLGRIVLDNIDVAKLALPHMRTLTEETGETAMLEIWDDGRTLVVAKVDGNRFTYLAAHAGSHLPAHGCSGGKAILAFLERQEIDKVISKGLKRYTESTITDRERLLDELEHIRKTHLSFDREEVDVGVCAVSAPIFDHLGLIAGALTVAGPMQRFQLSEDDDLAQTIKKTAADISRELGYQLHS